MNFGWSRQVAIDAKSGLFFKVFRQLFRDRGAFDQENETDEQRKDFQDHPDHAAAGLVLAGGKIIGSEREGAE